MTRPMTRPLTRHIPTTSRGFTLVEILVVIAILALLGSILWPALTRAGKAAQAVGCASNMGQCGMALKQIPTIGIAT